MRLTAFSDVSLRVLMLLSGLEGEQISTQKIAEGVGTPYNHVAKSVAFLANLGLVESTRGRTGGVRLSEAGARATVGQVLRASEGDIPMVECEGGANDLTPLLFLNCPTNSRWGRFSWNWVLALWPRRKSCPRRPLPHKPFHRRFRASSAGAVLFSPKTSILYARLMLV